MSPLLKKILKNLLFVALAVFFLWLGFNKVDFSNILATIKTAKLSWILLATCFGILSHVIRALRWQQLLKPLGYDINFKHSFIGVMIGNFVNFIIPRAGELSRCAMVNRTDDIPVQISLGTVITERIIDVFMLMLSLTLAIFSQLYVFQQLLKEGPLHDTYQKLTKSTPILIALFVVFLIGIILIWVKRKQIQRSNLYQKFKRIIIGFGEGIKSVAMVKNKFLFIFYTLSMWFCYFLLPYLVFFSLESTSHLGYEAGLVVLALGSLSMAAPAPGGIGVFHVLISSALVMYGLDRDSDGMSFATIAHGVQMLLIFTLGAFCFALVIIEENKVKKSKKNELS